MSNTCLYELTRIRIYRRCDIYYLRWYYNGWHYWAFYPGDIIFATEGEQYWTLGTQKMRIGTGQITEEQCNAIRTIQNTKEIYIYTDAGWGVVRIEHNSLVVYDHALHGYEIEITIVIGSRAISADGFSPAISLPTTPPSYPWLCELDIVIASQTWMCYNWDQAYPGSKVYNNDETNRAKFGGLYTWQQANAAGFCPPGWHVPTVAEWQTLIAAVGGAAVAGGELKAIGTTYWNAPNTGAVDSVDFDARGGGYQFAGASANIYQHGYYLTSSSSGTGAGWRYQFVQMDYNSAAIQILDGFVMSYLSVRLIKDAYTPTPHMMLLTSKGTGAGVSIVRLEVLRDMTITVDGTARFYDDATGTINPTTSRTVLAGAQRTFYLKCPSATANLTFSDVKAVIYINWTGYTNCAELSGTIEEFEILETCIMTSAWITITHTTAELPRTLTYLSLSGSGVNFAISGDCADFPAAMTYLNVGNTNTISGDIADMPAALTVLVIAAGNTLAGNINGLGAALTVLQITGNNTVTGDVAGIAGNLTTLNVTGNNTLSGDVTDLPATLTYFNVTGNNTITGDVTDLPVGMTYIYITGNNSINGDVNDLPAGLTYLYIHGANTINGDIADLPVAIAVCVLMGSNAVTGDITDIPATLKFFIFGGVCQVDTYSGKVWGANMNVVTLDQAAGFGLDAAEVDQLCIDLAATTWTGYKVLDIAGNNAAPTGASAAARAALVAMGVTVTTN